MLKLSDSILVIPAFEPGEETIEFIKNLANKLGLFRIFVVDDGSGPRFSKVFNAVAENSSVEVLTLPRNMGKGFALKVGFRKAMEFPMATNVITADSDGQHTISDILKVAAPFYKKPSDRLTTWGSRNFQLSGLPWRSKIGNRLSSLILWITTGKKLRDTQTGLRGFSKSLILDLIDIKGSRFEYESNVLLWLIAHKVPIEDVPIETIYHDRTNSISHFRPIVDSLIVFKQLGKFIFTSLMGAAVDILIYSFFVVILFKNEPTSLEIISAVVMARIVSSFSNYLLNREFVFEDPSSQKKSLSKYFILVTVVMTLSATATPLVSQVLGNRPILSKVLVDTVLFLVSFFSQKRWVFTSKERLES